MGGMTKCCASHAKDATTSARTGFSCPALQGSGEKALRAAMMGPCAPHEAGGGRFSKERYIATL
eukprot:NODE_12596_length_258_cov_116.463054.p2 GENE.NODE_12596_length_258_cov_116.463054~~NODE_12596_length_258_cov_116.463054.p2  ORF type:complete len:64 (-),score=1.07 NODE_12596_length_258_cov_116.463054:49-240(-)